MGVVDVEAGPVGEHGVGQVGLDHRGQRALAGEAAGVVARRLVLEVPADLLLDVRRVGVDQHRRGRDRVLLADPATWMPYSVSMPQTLGMATGRPYPDPSQRY